MTGTPKMYPGFAPKLQAAAAKVARNRGTSWVSRSCNHNNGSHGKLDAEGRESNVNHEEEEEDDAEAVRLAAQLVQFFALLPKLPGKHGAPMLSLAVESVAES